jgi:uncharacterized protein YwbE
MVSPQQPPSDHQRDGQITRDTVKSPEGRSNHQRDGQITRGTVKSPEGRSDHQRDGQITRGTVKYPGGRSNHQRDGQITRGTVQLRKYYQGNLLLQFLKRLKSSQQQSHQLRFFCSEVVLLHRVYKEFNSKAASLRLLHHSSSRTFLIW